VKKVVEEAPKKVEEKISSPWDVDGEPIRVKEAKKSIGEEKSFWKPQQLA